MATLQDMIHEVYGNLSGYGLQNDAITWLTADVTSASTNIPVFSAESAGRGLVEVGDELMWVDRFDTTSNTLVVPPFGRGFRGSSAAAHTNGTMVTFNPVYTRKAIITALNDTVRAVYPKLWAVSNTNFTYSPAVNTYALPSSAQDVRSVSFRAIGPSKEWVKVKGWRMDGAADVSEFSSTSTITLLSMIDPGAAVKVVYTGEPDVMEYGTDEFSDTTGLPDSAKDVIVLGACYRLMSTVDPSRIHFASPESEMQSGRIPSGSATSAAKYLYALYQARLQEESDKQQGKFPVTVHYTN